MHSRYAWSAVVLVDPRGWVLLQERDEHAPIDPNCWGLCGGGVEEGETFEAAAYRELAEETGVRAGPGSLKLWGEFEVSHLSGPVPGGTMALYATATELTDSDIVCGEGRQIVFVSPQQARGLSLTGAASQILPAFLDSELYAALGNE